MNQLLPTALIGVGYVWLPYCSVRDRALPLIGLILIEVLKLMEVSAGQ